MKDIIGKKAPSFSLKGVLAQDFSEYELPHLDGKWTVVIFYPLDFTFVCPTELIAYSDRIADFEKLNTKVLGVSVDSVFSHLAWTNTPRSHGGVGELSFPLLSDMQKSAAEAYGVLTDAGVALRGLFIIDDEGVVQSVIVNNLSVGRSVDETLRVLAAFQFTKESGDVCPANWQPGDDVMTPSPDGLKEYAAAHHDD